MAAASTPFTKGDLSQILVRRSKDDGGRCVGLSESGKNDQAFDKIYYTPPIHLFYPGEGGYFGDNLTCTPLHKKTLTPGPNFSTCKNNSGFKNIYA